MAKQPSEISLSPSSYGDYKKCVRCFWLGKVGKLAWPRGIFPSLPGGVDRVLKPYYDAHRAKGTLPPEIAATGKVKGLLWPNQDQMDVWRTRGAACLKTNVDGVGFSGQIDDLIRVDAGLFAPYDYKTRGAKWKEGASEGYYGPQMDGYALLVEANGHGKCTGEAHLGYYWPGPFADGGILTFVADVVTIEANASRARDLIRAAGKCLQGHMPDPSPECEQCAYVEKRGAKERELAEAYAEAAQKEADAKLSPAA